MRPHLVARRTSALARPRRNDRRAAAASTRRPNIKPCCTTASYSGRSASCSRTGSAERLLRPGNAGDVIEMRVRQQDVRDVQARSVHRLDHLVDLVARIDDDRLARALAAKEVPVLVERRRGVRGEEHAKVCLMIRRCPPFPCPTCTPRSGVSRSHLRRTPRRAVAMVVRGQRRDRPAEAREPPDHPAPSNHAAR